MLKLFEVIWLKTDRIDFDEIIAILEERIAKNGNYRSEKPPMQVQDTSRDLSEENARIADLKKYDLVLNKINVNDGLQFLNYR